MRKYGLITVIILVIGGLTLAAILRFARTSGDSAATPSSQPDEQPPMERAEPVALADRNQDDVATLRGLAELHAQQEEFDKARKEAQEALDIQSRLPDAKRWQITDARRTLDAIDELSKLDPSQRRKLREIGPLYDQILTLFVKGKFRDGIKPAQQIREITEQTLGDRHPDLAVSLNNLGVLHHALGEYGRAEPLYGQARDIFKTVLGEEHPDYVTTFNNLAVLYGLKGDYAKALPLYRRALELRKQVVGEKHPDYVRSVNNLAWLYKTMGDYTNAEPLYKKALQLHELGVSYGRPNGRILEIYRQVDLRRPPSAAQMQTDQALIVGNMAVCYHEMGDYAQAEPLYRQALEINKKTQGEHSAVYARNLNNLASLYQLMGDHIQAETLFKKAVALRKEALGENHPDYAASLHNLGRFYHLIEDYERAEPLYLQALAIRKQKLGEKHPYYAQTLDKLAWLYQAKGDYARAEPLYIQALEARKSSLGENHRYDATIVTNQALLYHALGNQEKAETLFRKSLEWTKKQVGEKHPEFARTMHHLAMLQLARHKITEAEQLGRQPVGISRDLLERCSGVQSERQQLAMVQTSRFYLDGYLTIAAQANAPAERVYAEILAWKGAVLARQRRLRLQRRHPELAETFTQLNRVVGRLAALALTVPDPKQEATFRRQIEELTEQKEHLESDLAHRSAAFRQDQTAARMAPADLRKSLPAEVALIDFLDYTHRIPPPQGKGRWEQQHRLTAFVVRSDRIEQLNLGAVQPLAQAIDRWRSSHGAGKQPPEGTPDPAVALRRQLWEPLVKHLPGVKVVLVSPDGPLHGLPFAALPGTEAGTFLIRDYAFATVPVPQLLPEMLRGQLRPSKDQPSLLLAGGIDFGQSKADGAEVRTGKLPSVPLFEPLHGTESEVNDLRAQFEDAFPDAPAPRVLRKERASKQAVLAAAPTHRFVHLATHGFFAAESEKTALAARSPDGMLDSMLLRAEAAGRHPGLLSGIVFAGVNRPDRSPEQTILTALEASELDLGKVELVVLSACETGRGQVAGGEGVLGLQRSFQLAGARSVVASLWSVPDEETHQLMREFYRRVWSDKPLAKAEALRQAQLWMLDNWKPRSGLTRPSAKGAPPPYVWAAFVLSGDWR